MIDANYNQPIPEMFTPQCREFLNEIVRQAVSDIQTYLNRRRMASARRRSAAGESRGTSNTLESITCNAIQSVLWLRRDLDTARVSFDLVCDLLDADPAQLWDGLDGRFAANRDTAGQWRWLKRLADDYLQHEQSLANQTGLLSGKMILAAELMAEYLGDESICDKGQLTRWARHGRYGRRLPVKKHKWGLYTTRAAVEWFFAEVPFQGKESEQGAA